MKKKEIPKPRLTYNCNSNEKKQNRNIDIFNNDGNLINNDNYFNIQKNIMSNELKKNNENQFYCNNLKSKIIKKKQPERKTIGLRNNDSNSHPKREHNMTDCNLETQDISSLNGGSNNKGKIINDNLKRNSEKAETKFISPFKGLLSFLYFLDKI